MIVCFAAVALLVQASTLVTSSTRRRFVTFSRFAVLVWICAVCDVFISWIRVCGPFSVAIFDGCASLVSKRSLVVAVLDVQKTEKETVKDSGAAGIRLGRVNKGKGDVGGACGVVCVCAPTGDSIPRMYVQPSRKLTWRNCVRASRKCAGALTHWAGPWCVCALHPLSLFFSSRILSPGVRE